MFNLVGKFKILSFSLLFFCRSLYCTEVTIQTENMNWAKYEREVQLLEREDYRNGLSYVISGSLALVGGIWGESVTNDAVEKGIYSVFQSIGIASVGYGAYLWQVGGEERAIYTSLRDAKGLSYRDKSYFLRSYFAQRKERLRREKLIRAITHGLVAAVNTYNASRQDQDGVRDALYFIGGVNLLAAISFTFDF